ncbi:hypothetical protein BDP27DRAFT_1462842, partial [Rhodocollybia butyracea]
LTAPLTDCAPLQIVDGPRTDAQFKTDLAEYNDQLVIMTQNLTKHRPDVGLMVVFDTRPVFNYAAGQCRSFWGCEYYRVFRGIRKWDTKHCNPGGGVRACVQLFESTASFAASRELASLIALFLSWLNTLYPLFIVHNILAQALFTALSTQ